MREGPDIARIAALIGDPARASMLVALMSGKALTVTELAAEAGVPVQTASGHLSQLDAGGLLRPRKLGRHKYFALASAEIAALLENLMNVAANAGHLRSRPGPRDETMRTARLCYNHLAGHMGVRMFDSLIEGTHIAFDGGDLRLSSSGRRIVDELGIDVAALEADRAAACRECLDWSVRRSHLAGSLGRALLTRFVELGWSRVDKGSRVVTFTPPGRVNFDKLFAVSVQEA